MVLATAVATAQRGSAPAAPAGTVVGKITYDGRAPRPRVVRMGADPLCMPEAKGGTLSEVLVVGPGNGLQNAFVYVKDGLGSRTFPAPKTPVVLDQQGCKYSPHVIGIQVGQPLEVRNSDGTLHNVHAVPKINKEFNFGQPTKGMKSSRAFDKVEVMVPFRCDVHGWMNAYAGVVAAPLLRRQQAGRQLRDQGPAARQLHHRGVARAARHADHQGHRGRQGGRHGQLRDEGSDGDWARPVGEPLALTGVDNQFFGRGPSAGASRLKCELVM